MNVLIGPNGAGKSELHWILWDDSTDLLNNLQAYVSKQGGPDAILHFGRKKSPYLSTELYFGNNGYKFVLEPTQDNRMMFTKETLWWNSKGDWPIGSGHFETMAEKDRTWIYKYTIPAIKGWRVPSMTRVRILLSNNSML